MRIIEAKNTEKVECTKKANKRTYRVIFKARKILVYKEVHEFFSPVENGSRKLLDAFFTCKRYADDT